MFIFIGVVGTFLFKNGKVIYLLFKRGFSLSVVWFLVIEFAMSVIPISFFVNGGFIGSSYLVGIIVFGVFIPALSHLEESFQNESNGNTSLSFNGSSGDDSNDSFGGDGGGGSD